MIPFITKLLLNMSLSKLLILASIVVTSTSQTECYANLSPSWAIGTGSGVITKTFIPSTATLTRIRADADILGSKIGAFDF